MPDPHLTRSSSVASAKTSLISKTGAATQNLFLQQKADKLSTTKAFLFVQSFSSENLRKNIDPYLT